MPIQIMSIIKFKDKYIIDLCFAPNLTINAENEKQEEG